MDKCCREALEKQYNAVRKLADGEKVPPEVFLLSLDPLTEQEKQRAREIAAQHGW